MAVFSVACWPFLGCAPPPERYANIEKEVDNGDFVNALRHVNRALASKRNPAEESHWRLRILKARILVSQSNFAEALALLSDNLPKSLYGTDLPEQRHLYRGIAHHYAGQFDQAAADFSNAQAMARSLAPKYECQLLIAVAGFQFDQNRLQLSEQTYKNAVAIARRDGLIRFEANALGNLGRVATAQGHLDEAISINQAALTLSTALGTRGDAATILGNIAWSYFQLGDFDGALDYFKQGAAVSRRSGLPVLAAYWLTGIANSEIALRDYTAAEKLAQDTLQQAEKFKNAQTIVECQNILTRTALQAARLDDAEKHNQAALQLERSGADHFGLPDSLILAGQIATARGRYQDAEQSFQEVLQNPTAGAPPRWQAQAGLAGVRQGQGKVAEAEEFYKAAIATIETARGSVEHEDLRLSFLSSAITVYGDYIDFLVRHGRPDDALIQADLSRARTLEEGLSTKGATALKSTSRLRPQELARRLRSSLLIYWLGEKQSYLWAVTSIKTECFKLPPAAEIDALVKTYREATLKSADLLATASDTGTKLYTALVEPAIKPSVEAALSGRPAQAQRAAPWSATAPRFIILPDGSLNSLNFETLIVPSPQPRFWIEDVTVATADSLSLLQAAASRPHAAQRKLLLVGDAVPVPEFGELPQAKSEIANLRQRFSAQRSAVLQGAAATPSAYLASRPERYSYLHFVTHGTASRARPLESAVILSKESQSGSYKLYARDIVTHPLKAELVTISACNGSGTRAYSGEGLVGLSWAFLRAGAHNVIGALWEVSDVSTPQLMDKMYAELTAGKDPATALRNAKLAFLHAKNVFAKPFYWAPFQLYTGS